MLSMLRKLLESGVSLMNFTGKISHVLIFFSFSYLDSAEKLIDMSESSSLDIISFAACSSNCLIFEDFLRASLK